MVKALNKTVTDVMVKNEENVMFQYQRLQAQRAEILTQLQTVQFQLADDANPKVVAHLHQLQSEQAKQQAILQQAQQALSDLQPQLQKHQQSVEDILLQGISEQRWFGFKNKPEIVFDSHQGLLFPNWKHVKPIIFNEWESYQKNFCLHNIGLKQWQLLSGFPLKTRSDNLIKQHYGSYEQFDYPARFFDYRKLDIYILDNVSNLMHSYACIHNESGKIRKSIYNGRDSAHLCFPALNILPNSEIRPDHPRLLPLERTKIIFDFFIEQDWLPEFEPELLPRLQDEDDEDFSTRYTQKKQEYNQLYDAFYQRMQLQGQLARINLQIEQAAIQAPPETITAAYSYQHALHAYDVEAIDQSVWQYAIQAQSWLQDLLNKLEIWETQHIDVVQLVQQIHQQLQQPNKHSQRASEIEKQLLLERRKELQKRLNFTLTPLRSGLLALLGQVKQLKTDLQDSFLQEDSLVRLAQLEQKPRPAFQLLAEHSVMLCTEKIQQLDWLQTNSDFVKAILQSEKVFAENYAVFVDKLQSDLLHEATNSGVDIEQAHLWLNEWREERLEVEKKWLLLVIAGLEQVLPSQSVLDIMSLLVQYQKALDDFYVSERKNIYMKFAFVPNGHRQDKLEKELELSKVNHAFLQNLERIIFGLETSSQKMWLIHFTDVWQHNSTKEVGQFLVNEKLLERRDIAQLVSSELRSLQQQTLLNCLQDAQVYSDALAQREKDFNALMFKMRTALMKEVG